MDFIPPSARPYERSTLIVRFLLGIKEPKVIAKVLGQKSKARIYKTLKKYDGKINLEIVQRERSLLYDDGHNQPLVRLFR